MKLALGAAQFGMNYGLSNKIGRVSQDKAQEILQFARLHNFEVIDTAAQYGCSEATLGAIKNELIDMKIVTKTVTFSTENSIEQKHAKVLKQSFYNSLRFLNANSCYALLVHHADDLLKSGSEWLMEALLELKRSGKVKKIGFSAYSQSQVERVLDRYTGIDIIQIPLNVLDQRLIMSKYLMELKTKNVEIHARSVFLQGLLLMGQNELDPYFKPLISQLTQYYKRIAELSLTPLKAALLFIKQIEAVDHIVVGVTSLEELMQIVQAYEFKLDSPIDFSFAAVNNEKFTNPLNWKLEQ